MTDDNTNRTEAQSGDRDGVAVDRRTVLKGAAALGLSGVSAAGFAAAAAPASVVVDSEDGTGVAITGSWTNSTYTAGYEGSNYKHDGNGGKGSKSVEYTPSLPVDGEYAVLLNWTTGDNRATNTPVDVNYDDGSATVTVDQTAGGGQWNLLGTWSFTAGTGESVTIRNGGTDGYVIADAVMFVPVVRDSEDSAGVSISGSWTTSTGEPGYYGSNYKHDGNSGKGSKAVAYTPTIPFDGRYEVFARWTTNTNRATNVPVDIDHDGCLTTVAVDQTQEGGTWNSLGIYRFSTSGGSVTIRNDGTDGYVVADAVKVVPAGEDDDATLPTIAVNQLGYDRGRPKRFTAPGIVDGTTFTVTSGCAGGSYQGTMSGSIGDFSAFDPDDSGPYHVVIDDGTTTHRSDPFEISHHLTELRSYRNAVEFFTGSRNWWGNLNNHDADYFENRGVAWRDQDGYAFIIPTLIDLYRSNPSALEAITVSESDEPSGLGGSTNAYQYTGLNYSLPSDAPEVVKLIHWGVETYLRANVNYSLMKAELAAFLAAYPELDEWIPQTLYVDVRDYLFPIWDQSTGDRHYVDSYYYTDHSKNLLTTYTQVGTSKGEFPPGFSIRANLEMYEVATREGRSDADRYLQAAEDQVDWIVNNLDVTQPINTKGQRQSEHVTVPGVVRFLKAHPNRAPSGTITWIENWASTMISRSNNLWDFRKWDADTWVSQEIPSYPAGDSINEPGNVAGFPAPALAAADVLDDVNASLAADLRRIAQSHIDNTFGRNPTRRHFSHRAAIDEYGFDGAERGWYSEYQGIGKLEGVRGVLDGSPKATHYPNDPGAGDVGWTEGWVNFNSAWNAALAWLSADDTELQLLDSAGNPVSTVGASDTVTVQLHAPLDHDASGQGTAEVRLRVGTSSWRDVTVTQIDSASPIYETDVDLASEGATAGDEVETRYGGGVFTQSAQASVGGAEVVVVDTEDSSQVTITGTWPTSTYSPDYVGSNYRHDDNAGKGSKSIAFTPELPSAGTYDVSLYWNSSPDRATAAPVDVDYDGGSTTEYVDQTTNGGQWNLIGSYQFTAGTNESVTIRNGGTTDFVIADAVKFEKQ